MTGAPKARSSSRHHLRRQRRRGGADEAQRLRAMVSPIAPGARQDRLVHGRHRRVPGRLHLVQPGEELERVEARRAGHAARPPPATTAPPAIRPWMWNSGMMLRQRSSGVRRERRGDVLRRGGRRCAGDSGTILGRDVVPEVCSTSATSSGCGERPGAPPARPARRSARSVKSPAAAGASAPARRSACRAVGRDRAPGSQRRLRSPAPWRFRSDR